MHTYTGTCILQHVKVHACFPSMRATFVRNARASVILSMWVHVCWCCAVYKERWALISFSDICVLTCCCNRCSRVRRMPAHVTRSWNDSESITMHIICKRSNTSAVWHLCWRGCVRWTLATHLTLLPSTSCTTSVV